MNTIDIRAAAIPRPSPFAELIRRIAKAPGGLAKPVAGRRFFTIWGTITYRGRRSGKAYTIPVAIGRTLDTFVIPMPFPGAQWVLNVLAAGEATVRWNGRDWHVTAPVVIEKADGVPAFGPIPRFALGRLPIHRFLQVHRAERVLRSDLPGA